MDKASRALAKGVPPDVPKSYRALADHSQVPASTLHHRARGRRSIEDKAKSQQYRLKDLADDVDRKKEKLDRGRKEKRDAAAEQASADEKKKEGLEYENDGKDTRDKEGKEHFKK